MVGGLLLQASACIVSPDDNSGGVLDVSWPVAACNSPTATVFSLNTDTQVIVMDSYNCSDGSTEFTANPIRLILGNYSVWVEIQDDSMTRRHAISNSSTVSFVNDGDTAVISTDPVENEQGNVEAEWTIADTGGTALTCVEAGVTSVRIVATLASNTAVFFDALSDCDQFYGKSDPIDPGLYTIDIELLDSAGQAINNNNDPVQETIIGNYTIHLGIIDFELTL